MEGQRRRGEEEEDGVRRSKKQGKKEAEKGRELKDIATGC